MFVSHKGHPCMLNTFVCMSIGFKSMLVFIMWIIMQTNKCIHLYSNLKEIHQMKILHLIAYQLVFLKKSCYFTKTSNTIFSSSGDNIFVFFIGGFGYWNLQINSHFFGHVCLCFMYLCFVNFTFEYCLVNC